MFKLKLIDMSSHRDRSAASRKLSHRDRAILNEAIPVFAIGRSQTGLWIARDRDSSAGGAFLSKSAAIRFAKHTGACAVMFVRGGLELDGTPSSAHRSPDPQAKLGAAIANINRESAVRFGRTAKLGARARKQVLSPVSIAAETRRLFEVCIR
jgi:hypothetical protein